MTVLMILPAEADSSRRSWRRVTPAISEGSEGHPFLPGRILQSPPELPVLSPGGVGTRLTGSWCLVTGTWWRRKRGKVPSSYIRKQTKGSAHGASLVKEQSLGNSTCKKLQEREVVLPGTVDAVPVKRHIKWNFLSILLGWTCGRRRTCVHRTMHFC